MIVLLDNESGTTDVQEPQFECALCDGRYGVFLDATERLNGKKVHPHCLKWHRDKAGEQDAGRSTVREPQQEQDAPPCLVADGHPGFRSNN